MRNKWKAIAACMVAVVGCVHFVGARAYAVEEKKMPDSEIEVIFNRNEADMQPYIAAFEEKYPEIKVTYTCYNDLETSIKLRMEEGDYGDVTYFPSFITTETAHEYFAPLGDYASLSGKYDFVSQGRVYDDIVYGIPSSAYLMGIVYNKEIFDKAGIAALPRTVDEFLEAMELISKHTDALPFYAGYKEPWILSYWEVFPYVEMTGSASSKFDDFVYNVNPFREGTPHNESLGLLYDLVANGYTEVGNTDMSWWESVVGINNGTVGCAVIGTWALYNYKTVGENGHNIGFMPFPNNIDGMQYATVAADYSYAIAKNSDNKEAARAFIDFMLDESGYAFDHDMISVLKTDPYPECYGDMTQTSIMNSTSATPEGYLHYNTLSSNLNLYDQNEYVRIVEAAAGIREESFEDIMNDWNMRWEASRDFSSPEQEGNGNFQNKDEIVKIENSYVELSASEISYIEENPVIRVGYHRNLIPLSFEKNEEFSGLARDICNLISEKSGLTMEYYGYDNAVELVEALKDGEVDFAAGIEQSGSYTGIRYSKEYLEYMTVLLRHKPEEVSLFHKLIGTDEKSAGYTIMNLYSASYYIRENAYENVNVIPYENHKLFHIGFPEGADSRLIAICNKCIYSLQEGEAEVILMEYMDSAGQKVSIRNFIRTNPFFCMAVITFISLMIMLVLYERYKSNRKQALDAERYKLLAALADESFFDYDYKKERFKFDAKFVNIVETENNIADISYSGDNDLLKQFIKQTVPAIEQKSDMQYTIVLNKEDGVKQWYRIVTSVVRNEKKQAAHLIGKMMNIQKEMEEVASYQDKAYRDALTKLYNREGLFAHIPAEASGVMLAVMDIDDFKMVNDTLGHGGGDYALMYLADKLEEHMGTKSLSARYGGDEFVILLTGVSEKEARDRLGELVKSMNVSLHYAGNSKKVSVSVGAVYSDSMNSFDEMFQQADEALYKTKECGKNNYRLEVNPSAADKGREAGKRV